MPEKSIFDKPTTKPTIKSASAKTDTTTKKSKKGLIIGLIIAAIVVIGGGLGAFFIIRAINNAPEKIALKTIQNALTDTRVSTSGVVDIKFDNSENFNNIKSARINIKGQSDILPMRFKANTEFTAKYDDYTLDLDGAIDESGVFYFKVDDLSDIFELTGASRSDVRQYSNVITMLEGNWWSIDVNDLYDLFLSQSSSVVFSGEDTVLTNPVSDLITCGTTAIEDYKSESKAIAELYAKYPFISFVEAEGEARNGGKLYQIKLNTSLGADFLAELQDLDLVTDFTSCIKRVSRDNDFDLDELDTSSLDTKELLRQVKQQLKDTVIEVKNYHIVGYTTETQMDDSVTISTKFDFEYPNDLTVKIPKNSTSIVTLFQNLFGGFSDFGDSSYTYDDYTYDYDYSIDTNCGPEDYWNATNCF